MAQRFGKFQGTNLAQILTVKFKSKYFVKRCASFLLVKQSLVKLTPNGKFIIFEWLIFLI